MARDIRELELRDRANRIHVKRHIRAMIERLHKAEDEKNPAISSPEFVESLKFT